MNLLNILDNLLYDQYRGIFFQLLLFWENTKFIELLIFVKAKEKEESN